MRGNTQKPIQTKRIQIIGNNEKSNKVIDSLINYKLLQISSFLDGSVVYGSEKETVEKLREHRAGRLKMQVTEDGRELLPVSEKMDDGCNREEEKKKGRYCFMTGME